MCPRCRLAQWWTSPVTNWFVDQFSIDQQEASIHSNDWELSATILNLSVTFVFRCLDPRMQRRWQEAGPGWGVHCRVMSVHGGFWLGDKLRQVQWRSTEETDREQEARGEQQDPSSGPCGTQVESRAGLQYRESWLGNEPQVCLTVWRFGHAHDTKWTAGERGGP